MIEFTEFQHLWFSNEMNISEEIFNIGE